LQAIPYVLAPSKRHKGFNFKRKAAKKALPKVKAKDFEMIKPFKLIKHTQNGFRLRKINLKKSAKQVKKKY